MKKEMLGSLNVSLKSMETKDELLISRCLSAPDAMSLRISLPQEQVAKTKILSVVMV